MKIKSQLSNDDNSITFYINGRNTNNTEYSEKNNTGMFDSRNHFEC